MKFRKKPVEIEAMQWTGDNLDKIYGFMRIITPQSMEWWETTKQSVFTNGLFIKTLEGNMRANVGDWIIKGVQGEFYPCKPDIFEQTYELMDVDMKDIEIKTRRVGLCLEVIVTIDGFHKNIGLYEKKEAKELLESLDDTKDELVDFIGEEFENER